MMDNGKGRLAAAVVAIAVVLAGCWDYVDVEQRSLVMAVGVDLSRDDPTQLMLSVEVPVPAASESGGGGENGGGEPEPKLVESADGMSVLEAGNNLRARMERDPLWDQIAIIVVSEDVARDGIGRITDAIMRFHALNMRAHLYISSMPAQEVFQFEPQMQPLTARHLRGIAAQFTMHPKFPRPEPIVLVHRRLREQRSSLVPKLTMEGDDLLIAGAGVLYDGQLVGWLDELEAEGANWILGLVTRSLVQFRCPGHPEGYVVAWARLDRHRIRTSAPDGRPRFDVDISVTARLVDMTRCPLVPENKEDADKIEEGIVKTITERIDRAVHRAQRELHVDFLGFVEQWRRNFSRRASEQEWTELFPEADIQIHVAMSPTGIGFPGQLRETVPYR